MSKFFRQSPLGTTEKPAAFETQAARLVEEPFLVVLKVMGRSVDARKIAELGKALGLEVPTQTGRVAEGADGACACVAPDEWLVFRAKDDAQEIADQISQVFAGDCVLVCDLTHARSSIVVSGKSAEPVLSSIIPLDLAALALGKDQCITTSFGETSAYVQPVEGYAAAYRVIVDQSYAKYAWRFLEDTCRLIEADELRNLEGA